MVAEMTPRDTSVTLQEAALEAPRDEYLPIVDLLETLRQRVGHQRALNKDKARKLADNLDPRALGRLVVSRRADGTLWLLDGQHRAYAMRLRGLDLALCAVYTGLSLADEAELWGRYNTHAMPAPTALYHGALRAGDAETCEIDRIIREWGFHVPEYQRSGASPHAIGSVVALRYVYQHGGSAGLSLVLQVLHTAWPKDPRAITGNMIQGMGILLHTFGSEIEIARLIRRCTATPPLEIQQLAAAQAASWRIPGAQSFAVSLASIYNHGQRDARRVDPARIGRPASQRARKRQEARGNG